MGRGLGSKSIRKVLLSEGVFEMEGLFCAENAMHSRFKRRLEQIKRQRPKREFQGCLLCLRLCLVKPQMGARVCRAS